MVVLRDFESKDVEAFVHSFVEDPPMAAILGEETVPDVDEARRRIAGVAERRERGERVNLAIADRADDNYLGDLALHHFDWRHRRVEIGFFVRRPVRGRGIALEAVRLATGWALTALGVDRVTLVTNDDNVPAQRLAERAGFTYEGTLRSYTLELGRRRDNFIYSMLKAEWAA